MYRLVLFVALFSGFALSDASAQIVNGDDSDNIYTNSITAPVAVSRSYGGGDDMLTNSGTVNIFIAGSLDFGTGDDVLVNEAGGIVAIFGSLLFGAGDNRITNSGILNVWNNARVSFGAGTDRIINEAGANLNIGNGNNSNKTGHAVLSLGAGDDSLSSSGAVRIGFVDTSNSIDVTANLDFGEGDDSFTSSDSVIINPGSQVSFGAGDDSLVNTGTGTLTMRSNAAISFGAGNDAITNAGIVNIEGTNNSNLGRISFGEGDDIFTNEAGAVLNVKGSAELLLGAGNDRVINAGAITITGFGEIDLGSGDDIFENRQGASLTISQRFERLVFGKAGADGYDRLINDGAIIFTKASTQSQFLDVFEQGASGSLSLVTGFATATTAGILFANLESLLLDGVINLGFTGTAPATIPAEYRVIAFHPEAAVHIASGFRLVISETNLSTLGIANLEVIPTISPSRQFILLREDPSILPARVYDVATKPSLDCSTVLVCKGSNALSSIDSATITLSANGFAVEGGIVYYAKPTGFLLSSSLQNITAKIQIEGVVYVGDVSLDDNNKPALGSGTNHGFAELSGDGSSFEILNYGSIIASGNFGAISFAAVDSVKIYNEGSISTAHTAIKFSNENTGTLEITNKGSIRAGGEAIYVDGGVVTIDNEGSIYSSILSDRYTQSPSAINATISVDSNLQRSGALVIINRKNGEIIYTVGDSYSGTEYAGAAVFVNGRSNARIYNEGLIVGGVKQSVPSILLTAHGIIWKESTGSISNRGGIYSKDETIKIEDLSDITLYNKGIINSANKAAIEISSAVSNRKSTVTITNYGNGVISGNSYGINALAYSGIYITNLGEIRAAINGGVALSFRQAAGPAGMKGAALIDTKTLVYNLGDIIGATGIYLAGAGVVYNNGADSLIYGADKAVHITHGRPRYDNGVQRSKITIFNAAGAKINSPAYGIYVDAAQNTDFTLNNRGDVSGDGASGYGLYVDIDETKFGASFKGAKLTITNHARGGIYGRSAGIRIVNILDNAAGTVQTVDEKITIQNAGGILGRDIGILIDEPISFLDITNEASGVIVGENIAIQVLSENSGGSDMANYLITNKGHILSDTMALHNPGQGHLQNTGFILGDIVIVKAGSVVNEASADNILKKDLFGRIAGQLYSYKTAIDVASGVIIGNIYFYDVSGDDKGTAIAHKFVNSGTVYGNIDLAKGDDIYEHRGNGSVEGIITPGDGADTISVASGVMALNLFNKRNVDGDKVIFDSADKIEVAANAALIMNIAKAGEVVSTIASMRGAAESSVYIGNISLAEIFNFTKPILDLGSTNIDIQGSLGVQFRLDRDSLLFLPVAQPQRVELLTTSGSFSIADSMKKPIIMDISFALDSTNKKIYMTYNGLDFTNAGELPNAPEGAHKFAEYLQRLLEAEEIVGLPAGYSLLSSLITIDTLSDYIAKLEEALGVVNYDALLSDLSEISGVSGFVDDFTSANCAVRDRSHQSLVVRHEESGCSWTSFTEQSIGGRDEQAITSGRQAPLGEHWVSMVAGQYKKVELVDRVEGHARDSETYLLGAGLRSRAPIANVAEVSVSLTMGRGEHRRNREWASVQQASIPEMNFQMVRIGASRSFALPLKGSWKITPSTDVNLVRVDISDLQHEGSTGDRVFAVDDMEHNRQSVRAGIELRGEHESERGASITAFARIGVEHYVNGRSAGYSIRLVGASQGFTYYGRAIDENVLTTSFGITSKRGRAISIRAFYEGKQGIGGIYENHEAKLELLRRF